MGLMDILDFLFQFLIIGVVFRGLFMPWFGKLLTKMLKVMFIRSERELRLWNHFYSERHKKSK